MSHANTKTPVFDEIKDQFCQEIPHSINLTTTGCGVESSIEESHKGGIPIREGRDSSENKNPKLDLHGRSHKGRGFVQELTKQPTSCWPSNKSGAVVSKKTLPQIKKFYSIKEVSQMYGIGQWLIYHHIKADPTFPYVNVGIKKKLLIDLKGFEQWLMGRSQKNNNEKHYLPSVNELMETGA